MKTASTPDHRRSYFKLGRIQVRALSALALGCLVAWFVLKMALPLEPRWAQLTVSGIALCGMVCCAVVFLTTYSFVANAPVEQIDERELLQRNSAYVLAYQVVAAVVLMALLFLEIGARWVGATIGAAQYEQLLTIIFFAQLVLPAAVLAWRDPPAED